MGTKFSIENEQLKELGKQLESFAGLDGVIRATENALKATDDYVTKEVEKAVASSKYNFNRTGTTKGSIDKDRKVEWNGTVASAKAGFSISNGGLPSIFLMYGTPRSDNPIKPDSNLKNAAKGQGIHRQKINQIQQEVFTKVIKRVMEK